jgi:penicillin V acylase-like amidase (Ntn superfamily)
MYARNFDFGQALPTIVTLTKPTKGYMYFSNTSYTVYTDKPTTTDPLLIQKLASVSTYVPLDGMNEKGLVVSMNNVNYYSGSLLVNQHYPNRVNLTMTLLFKYLLENAGTVEEAQEIINNVNIHDDLQTSGMSQHLQIADNLGNSAIVEFANDSNNTTQYVYPRTNESFLVNENFPEFGIDD